MKKEMSIVSYYCDICGKEIKKPHTLVLPIQFTTEQNEGKPVDKYIEDRKVDLCNECFERAVPVYARGAQGHNTYYFLN